MGMLSPKKGPMSEINVTPLVDVMLVLLIIFMVTAPLMYSGIKLDLPKTKKVSTFNLNKKQVIISVDKEGKTYLEKKEIPSLILISRLQQELKQLKTETIYIQADTKLEYGVLAKLMANLKSNGLSQIALVTEVETKNAK